jgi:cell division protein FtsA
MAEQIIAGLDIGSSTIRVVIAQVMADTEGQSGLHIVGAVCVPSEGMHRGSVSSMEEVVSSISKALERAERMTGIAVTSAWVSIAGQHVLVQESRGVVGVSRPDGEIQESDIERAIEAARTVATPSNYEILHVVPKSFTVDGQRGIKDPLSMNGIRLEVDAVIIQTISSQIKNITKSVYRTGIEIDDLVFTPLATAEAVLSKRQKELGVCLADIGATSTSLVVYEEGDILHTAVLPIGGDHITNDIAIGLRTSLDVARSVKHEVGHASPKDLEKNETYRLSDFGSQEGDDFKSKFVAEICEARVEEICEAIDAELKKVDRSGMLPVGIVFTGASLKLPGFSEVAKKTLRLPVALGIPDRISSAIDEVHDIGYATAIGLVAWGYTVRGSGKSKFNFNFSSLKPALDRFTKLIKKIIP